MKNTDLEKVGRTSRAAALPTVIAKSNQSESAGDGQPRRGPLCQNQNLNCQLHKYFFEFFSRENHLKRQNGWRITNASCEPDQREKNSQAWKYSFKSQRYKRKQSSRRSLPPRALHLRRLRLCYLRDHHESSGFRRTIIQSLKLVQNISS
ncbi:unnamed protein product [Oikopleura dioica]|uniref:Uncharacterized protein n=1 Tax=Oikopleura dioica TaxID=34765 RepID=E4YI12_OIKDI|nr:unnamed protein product [Oikopleura dioica]